MGVFHRLVDTTMRLLVHACRWGEKAWGAVMQYLALRFQKSVIMSRVGLVFSAWHHAETRSGRTLQLLRSLGSLERRSAGLT